MFIRTGWIGWWSLVWLTVYVIQVGYMIFLAQFLDVKVATVINFGINWQQHCFLSKMVQVFMQFHVFMLMLIRFCACSCTFHCKGSYPDLASKLSLFKLVNWFLLPLKPSENCWNRIPYFLLKYTDQDVVTAFSKFLRSLLESFLGEVEQLFQSWILALSHLFPVLYFHTP